MIALPLVLALAGPQLSADQEFGLAHCPQVYDLPSRADCFRDNHLWEQAGRVESALKARAIRRSSKLMKRSGRRRGLAWGLGITGGGLTIGGFALLALAYHGSEVRAQGLPEPAKPVQLRGAAVFTTGIASMAAAAVLGLHARSLRNRAWRIRATYGGVSVQF